METYRFVLCCALLAAVAAYNVPDDLTEYDRRDDLMEIVGSSGCKCKNGRCVTDNRGKTKCACPSGYALQDEFTCEPCDCGELGRCMFIEHPQSGGGATYEKKCLCDQGSAEKDGVCIDCQCGENSKCEFEGEEKICYCIDGYSEKDGVCTKCDCGFNGECKFVNGQKTCKCDAGYLVHNGYCKECNCGQFGGCSLNSNGNKVCSCNAGYSDNRGTCQKCDCGPLSVGCGFVNGQKSCTCKPNRAQLQESCVDCNCGPNSNGCRFVGTQKECQCQEGYVQKQDQTCRRACNAQNPCKNGGQCDKGICRCLPGTSGEFCEVVPGCVNKNCGPNARCVYDVGTKTAVCKCDDANLAFDPLHNKCRKSCEQVKQCKNGGRCVSRGGNHFCDCLPGTSGDLCEIVDDCVKVVDKCKGGSRCVFDVEFEKAICECPNPDHKYDPADGKCKNTCDQDGVCKNGGQCMHSGDYLFCKCKPGTSGTFCEIIDDCVRGICGDKDQTVCGYDIKNEKVTCGCKDPNALYDVKGRKCIPCDCGRNAVSCKFVQGNKVCGCRHGYGDENGNCKKQICIENKCTNGKCDVTSDEREVCTCYEGYRLEGNDNCRKLNCSGTPCINGTCIVKYGNREQCVCPSGYTLEYKTGICIKGNCSIFNCFGGRCQKVEGELMCVCPERYALKGIGCFETVCTKRQCFGGWCMEEKGKQICVCPKYHVLVGNVCKRVRCNKKNCYGGDCVVENGEELCTCPPGQVLFQDVCREVKNPDA